MAESAMMMCAAREEKKKDLNGWLQAWQAMSLIWTCLSVLPAGSEVRPR